MLWLEMPYIRTKGEQLLRALKKKLLRCLNITNVNLQVKTRVSTTKLNFYTNAKDKVPKQNKSNIIYGFTYPISVATLARLTERFWNELKNMHTKTRKVLYTST